jgi:hypothetical protein
MGLAYTTVGLQGAQAAGVVNPVVAAALAPETLTVRNFATTDKAFIEAIGLQFVTQAAGDKMNLLSPQLADDVFGIALQPKESPSSLLMPRQSPQQVYPGDTLVANVTDVTASDPFVASLHMAYMNLPGAAARVTGWPQISGSYINFKSVTVQCAAVARTFVDTVLGAQAVVLKSNRDYAVLGYTTDVGVCAVGVLGAFTSNYRFCGPGVALAYDTAEWYAQMDQDVPYPHVPVFNGKDIGAIFVSVLSAATVTVNVTLQLVELPLGIVP